MGALRHVRTLHIRSVHQSLLQRGAILIEDGLRTASLPGADGSRLLIVQRLPLGNIQAGWSSTSVSLLIERCFRQLGASAVHAEEPGAEHAAAVYFRDEVEPYFALALRISLGKDVSAWFWKLAVRDWLPSLSKQESLRRLLFAVLHTAPGKLAVVRLMQTLLQAHALEPLLSALEPQDGKMLLQIFGWSVLESSGSTLRPSSYPTLDDGSYEAQLLASFCNTRGETDHRSFWLACLLLTMQSPALNHAPILLHHASSLIRLVRHNAARQMEYEHNKIHHIEETKDGMPPINSSDTETGEFTDKVVLENALKRDKQSNSTFEISAQNSAEVILNENIAVLSKPIHSPTSRAGLFFLIPVMGRVDLPQWLEEHSENSGANFPAQTLRMIARRLETPTDDPIWLALDEIETPAPDNLVELWVSRLRTYSRRVARIGLHSLVCRTGRISATPTHTDVFFLASDADIRVRRAGLDIEPGWVPWFGRVLHFHYVSRGDFNG